MFVCSGCRRNTRDWGLHSGNSFSRNSEGIFLKTALLSDNFVGSALHREAPRALRDPGASRHWWYDAAALRGHNLSVLKADSAPGVFLSRKVRPEINTEERVLCLPALIAAPVDEHGLLQQEVVGSYSVLVFCH
ncbi:hypothetical protein CB1_000877018 [Camelus ferus]|nr:hypothetical protein CB1_000877018 [Camelus ferus]